MGLSLKNMVDVRINVAPSAPAVNVGCNIGLIIGTSNVITTTDRVVRCNSLADVVTAGFQSTHPELSAASMYFAQSPKPSVLYIGVKGAGETVSAALEACLEIAYDAYGVYYIGATDAEISTLAGAMDARSDGVLFFDSDNDDCLVVSPSTPDVFSALVTAGRKRAFGIYSETDYAGVAMMGLAMGRETGAAGSAFNMAYGTLVNVDPEDVTQTQVNALMAKNGNIYVTRGQVYDMLEMGRLTDGKPYDEVMYIDMTRKLLTSKMMAALYGNKAKQPQTDDGMAVFVAEVSNAMDQIRDIGFIEEGIWTGDPIGDLEPGDVVVGGYAVFVDSFDTMDPADRADRKAPPIWVAMKLAGTIECIVINVVVNL